VNVSAETVFHPDLRSFFPLLVIRAQDLLDDREQKQSVEGR
jgi:hypothetical protein